MTEQLLNALNDPKVNEFRPIPFWSWNGALEPDELKRQIRWMKENGMGGFFMHARSGLQTEYLSEEWFRCVESCAREAEKLGMEAWAYDENGWPSGFVGGKLLEREEDRDCYLLHTQGAFDPEATVSYRIDGDELIRTAAGGAGEYLNVTVKTAVSTTDILNPDLVGRFLQMTHQKYCDRMRNVPDGKVCGFFTDEPQYQRWQIPYTRMLPAYFREHYGEDVLDGLGLLILKKKGYRRFRYRYWKALQDMMLHSFAKQIYDWCEANGVQLTGHFVQEDTVGYQLTGCAGVMPFYEYEHIPGIDWLGRTSNNSLPARQVYSAAAQVGKKKILTESFGCCGWDISPDDLGRILGFQLANGVNLLCHHLIPYAEHGNRKRDFPAHYSPINPWVEDGFRDFNLCFTRLGFLLGEGREEVSVAVLHPIRSAYFDYDRELEETGFGIAELEQSCAAVCRSLEGRNIAYHFLDETLLARHGFVDGDRIGCGKMSYRYLVIPPIETMDASTERLIRAFAENGGKLLLAGKAPTYLEDNEYDYSYLRSNCGWDEIAAAQPYRVADPGTALYSTLRRFADTPFLFVQNASDSEPQVQTFDLGADVHSFDRVDPVTLAVKNIPLTVRLEKNEFALLIPSEKMPESTRPQTALPVRFSDARVSFRENCLTLDMPRMSTDGVHFSEPRYVYELFDSVLKERYEGKLFLRYDFEVRELPGEIFLRAEEASLDGAALNGVPLTFREETEWNRHFYRADISDIVREGKNSYQIELDWKQSDEVYFALFGENVTESLKNSLLFCCEIEPVTLCGRFGVYAADGFRRSEHKDFLCADSFYIGAVPETVSEPVTDGFPFFSGKLTLSQQITVSADCGALRLEGNFQTASLRINGQPAGNLLFGRTLDAAPLLHEGENLIEAELTFGNRNLLGPHHYGGEKYEDLSPEKFELTGKWENGTCPQFHRYYDFLRLYPAE